MHGGDARVQGKRKKKGRDVRVADNPGRIGLSYRLPIETGYEINGQLAAPRRNDGANLGIEKEILQFPRALPSGRGRRPAPVHALADVDLESPGAHGFHGKLQPGLQGGRHTARRRRDGHRVAGGERLGETRLHLRDSGGFSRSWRIAFSKSSNES